MLNLLMKHLDINTGFFSHGVLNLSPKECFDKCKIGAIIIDVRESYMNSFKMFKVNKIIYLPFSELEEFYQDLPVEATLIFADAVGLKSRESVIFMEAHGYENVVNMAGGIVDWERDGLPITTDINNRLSGSCMCQLKAREGGRGKRNERRNG